MTKEDFVYFRIGMALISAQRMEFLTGQLFEYLVEFDKEIYEITTLEFLEKSAKSKSAYKTLGAIFTLLKLNPKSVIEDELNSCVKKRNLFVHIFWATPYLRRTLSCVLVLLRSPTAIDSKPGIGNVSQRLF